MSSTFEFDPRMNRRQLLRAGAGGALGIYGLGALAGCTVERPIDKPESTAAVKPEIDGDLLLFNWAQYMDPDIKKRFSEKYGVAVNEVNFDNLEAMVTKLRAGGRYDIIWPSPEYAVSPPPGGAAASLQPRQPQQREGDLDLLRPRLVGPRQRLHGSLHLLHDRDRLAQRHRQRDDRFLERPHEPGRGRQDVHPRRLPGGDRRGEPDQRLTTQHHRSGRARGVQADLLDQKENARGFSTERPRTWSPAPPSIHQAGTATSSTSATRSTTRELQVPEVQGGRAGRHRLIRIPINAAHPGTALTFIDWILEPENARPERRVEWLPDAVRGRRTRRSPSWSRTSPRSTSPSTTSTNGQQYANLDPAGRALWDQAWTEVKAA